MAIIAPVPITAGPAVPDSSDPEVTFDALFEAFNAWLKNNLQPEANALGTNVYNNALEAQAQAGNAADSAGTAIAQAGNAADSAGTATTKAGEALASANSALQSVVDAAALLDQFDDRYLGVKAGDPTLDNDGNALVAGAIYVNSVSGFLRAYTGSGWVQGISSVAGVSSVNSMMGAVTVQETLVSGANIKTINGGSLLGGGDLAIATNATGSTLYLNTTFGGF